MPTATRLLIAALLFTSSAAGCIKTKDHATAYFANGMVFGLGAVVAATSTEFDAKGSDSGPQRDWVVFPIAAGVALIGLVGLIATASTPKPEANKDRAARLLLRPRTTPSATAAIDDRL